MSYNKPMRFVLWLLATLAFAAVFMVVIVVAIGFFLSPQDKLTHTDMVVAISGGETPARTAEAVRLYKAGWAPKLLFSGAAADHSGPSNAAAMKEDALSQGVPEKDILIEEDSANTTQNAAKVAPIIQEHGVRSLILVTSPYHQRRASLTFREIIGPDVRIINHSSVDSVWRKSAWWKQPYTVNLTMSELQKTLYVWSTKPQVQ